MKQALTITSFVAVMMLVIEYVNVLTQGARLIQLTRNPWGQYLLAAFGCPARSCIGSRSFASTSTRRDDRNPIAAFCVDDIVEHVDFLSLETNDLTQFMLAGDRENLLVARYYQEDHRCLFKLVEWVCAQAQGKLVAFCGELASRSAAVGRLLQAGVRMLSVAPPLLPLVKQEVRRVRVTP